MKGLAQLDPTYAMVDEFASFCRKAFFVGILGMQAQFVGAKIFALPKLVGSIRMNGLLTVVEWPPVVDAQLPLEWLSTLFASLFYPATIIFFPVIVVASWTILRSEEVKLWPVATLALAQPLDTFLVRQMMSPLSGLPLVLAAAAMGLYLAAVIGAIFLWRGVRER